MTPLRDFLPYVLPHAYGCPEPVAEMAIRDACIEFCGRSLLIQTVDTQSTTAGVAEYDVPAPAQQSLCQVMRVTLGASELKRTALDDVRHGAAMRAGLDTVVESQSGTPQMYYQTTPTAETVCLWPVPSTTGSNALAIRAAFAPTRTATSVDDALYDDWANEIASGALARLLAMPAQVFTNPKYAQAHEARFAGAIAAASTQARRGRLTGASRVAYRAFP